MATDKINKGNFLSWYGSFTDKPFNILAGNVNVNLVIKGASITFAPLANSTSTYAIDLNSVEITLQDNNIKPAVYDSVSNTLTYYPPLNVAVGEVRQLKFRFYDIAGHISNTATIFITIQDRATAWRPYGPSMLCRKDGSNVNTGDAYYQQLEKYYLDDNTAYIPQALKANAFGQPDYVPDFQNFSSCPTPSTNGTFFVYNQGHIYDAIVAEVYFNNSIAFSLNLNSFDPQPFQINIPPGIYEIIVVVEVINRPASVRIIDTSGFDQIQPVNQQDGQQQITFTGVTAVADYSGTITLY